MPAMVRSGMVLLVAIATLPASRAIAQAAPDPSSANGGIVRKGFTLALSIGVGAAVLSPPGGGSSTEPAIGGVNVSLGGFLRPDLALLGRVGLVNYGPLKSSNI